MCGCGLRICTDECGCLCHYGRYIPRTLNYGELVAYRINELES